MSGPAEHQVTVAEARPAPTPTAGGPGQVQPTTRPTPTPAPTTTLAPTPRPEPTRAPAPTGTAPAVPQPSPSPTGTTESTPTPAAPSPSPSPTTTHVPSVVPWAREPAAASSTIPGAAIVTALLILVVTAAVLVMAYRRTRGEQAAAAAGTTGVASTTAGPRRASGGAGTTGSDGVPGLEDTAEYPAVPADGHDTPEPVPAGALGAASDPDDGHTRADADTDATGADGRGQEAHTPGPGPAADAVPTAPVGRVPAAGSALGAATATARATPDAGAPGGADADASSDPLASGADRPRTDAPTDPGSIAQFLLVVGEALTDASTPVVQVQQTLQRIATVNDAPDLEVVALPTALLVSLPGATAPQTLAASAGGRALRLHQVQDVLEVAEQAEVGAVDPVAGTDSIRKAVDAPPLYGGLARVLGYVAASAGLAMILGGGVVDVLVASVLGAGVAGLQVLTGRLPAVFQALVVLLSAFAVSAAVFALSRTGIDIGTLASLVAPLATFLPGAQLTTAAIDLATRQMIAGSARLAAGLMQLVLLALGITSAAALVGVPASAVASSSDQALGWFGPWLGVLVYGVGVTLHYCAHRTALPWILVVLVVAYAGQVLGGLLFGGAFSAFVGALAMTPVAVFAATRPTGPPALVGFLPGFWLLVPGALGLVGVTSIIGDSSQALTTVVTAGTTMVAISLGVLAGIAIGGVVARPGRPVQARP